MIQEQAVPVGGDVVGSGDGDVGRVHVGHLAPVGRRAHQPVEGRERDPGGEEEHGPQPAVAAESSHAVRGSIKSEATDHAHELGMEPRRRARFEQRRGRRRGLWIGRGDLGLGIRWRPAEAGDSPAKCYDARLVLLRPARGVSGEDEAGSGRDQGEVGEWRRFGGDEAAMGNLGGNDGCGRFG